MEEVMLTKLMPPTFDTRLLTRDRLLQPLRQDKGTIRILEITAPAGYGKTVLAQQLSRRLDKPLVWLQLDHHDNEVFLFLRLLLQGLQRYWPGLGSRALQLFLKGGETGNNPRLIATLLINDLIRVGAKPMIVFDDAHELIEPTLIQMLQELLINLPSGIISVIAGRSALPLNLTQLYITGEARQLGAKDLAFSSDEIAALIEDRYGRQDSYTVEIIEKLTEGWPVALMLSEAIITGKTDPLQQLKPEETSLLYDYLASEVLEQLPADCREFLLESAVLVALTPEQCNRLLEREDSAALLETLDKKHSLLIPLAGMNNAYRLHQLFREFLIENLGKKRSMLLRRAGRLAADDGDVEMAVEYFLQADFEAEIEAFLSEAGRKALMEGRWPLVSRWLDRLKKDQIAKSPWLSYFRAAIEVYQGRLYEAEKWLEKADTIFKDRSDPAGITECRLLQARILRCLGRYRESMTLLEQIASCNKQETAQRFDLVLEKGYNLFLSGELPAAEKYFMEALAQIRQSDNLQAVIYLTEALGNICYQQGKHTKAMQLYQWCLRVSGDRSLPGYYIQDAIPYIYCDWGELEKALELAEKSLSMKLRYQMTESLPSAYSSLAYVHFEMADYEKTEELITKALQLLEEHGAERFYLILSRMVLAWARLAQGHWVEAREHIEKTLAEAETQDDQVCSMVQTLAGTALALMGSIDEAEDILLRSEENLKKMNFRIRLCDNYKALAYVYHTRGDRKSFQKYARRYLKLGARMNYIANKLHFTADLLEPILQFSLEKNIETLYAQRMISRLGRRSHKLLLELAEHPDPSVRQRIIAPLTEMADEQLLQQIEILARDSSLSVSQTAKAYLCLQADPDEQFNRRQAGLPAGAPRLEVKTFGQPQFFVEGREITNWRTKKTRELLSLLIHLSEPADKERLREELWSDLEPWSSNALFGTTIHYLRKRLEQEGLTEIIRFSQGLYSLNPGFVHNDSAAFEKMLEAALHQEPLQELGTGLLGRAVQLYRGDYMADPDDYAWALPRQVHLRHLYIEALITLSRYFYSGRNYRQAHGYLLKLKEADPLYEPAHHLLIKIYSDQGRKKALVEEHHNFKLLLMEETGLQPTPETTELFLRLTSSS